MSGHDDGPSMGEYEEMYGALDQAALPDLGRAEWVTRDGRRIPIAQMSDGHLVNTIRMLRRNRLLYELREVAIFSHGFRTLGGDGALDALDRESSDWINRTVEMTDDEYLSVTFPLTYPSLLAEARKRGLDLEGGAR